MQICYINSNNRLRELSIQSFYLYFKGELGNLLALAAAKITEVCIVIFTSLEHIPIVPVVPVEKKDKKNDVAVSEVSGSVQQSVSSDECKGRGAAKKDAERKFCKQIVGGVPSRCVCYKAMKGCHHRCHCLQCDNPYGTSQSAKAVYPLRRVRHPHKLKGKKNKRDANMLLDQGVAPLLGWNGVQSMIFDCLVDYMI